MLKSFKTLAVIFMLFAAVTNTHADKIRIKLHQPPPNMLGVSDMWNLTLENTTKSDLKIYLTGTATEDKDGLIIEGKSKVFTIKPGITNYKYNDFSGAEVKYNNGKYKEVILRTGNAPEGSYTICANAFEESGEIAGMENCIMQTIQQLGSITLISPEDKAELDPDTLPGLMFSWTPLPKGGPYSLRIVELKGDQSPDVAIKENRPILDVDGIKTTTYHVAPSQVKVIVMGMKYAWQVSRGDVVSEVISFSRSKINFNKEITEIIFPKDKDTIHSESLYLIWKNMDGKKEKYTYSVVVKDERSGNEVFSKSNIKDTMLNIGNLNRNINSSLQIELTTKYGSNNVNLNTVVVHYYIPCYLFLHNVGSVGVTILGGPANNLEDISVNETDWLLGSTIYVPPGLPDRIIVVPDYIILPFNPSQYLTITIQDLGIPPQIWWPCDPPPGCDFTALWETIKCNNFNNTSAPVYSNNMINPGDFIPINLSLFIPGKQYLLRVFDQNGPNCSKAYLFQIQH